MSEEIIDKARQGDKKAFALLFSEDYRKQLYVIARARLGNEEDAKDVVQDTVLEAYKNIGRLRDITKFKYWINRILINNCNNIYRDKNRNNISFEYYIEKRNKNISDEYIYIDRNIDLYEMIDILTPEEKDIIIMYISGYTSKDIAKILYKNDNTIRTKIMRIKQKIRLKYGRGDK